MSLSRKMPDDPLPFDPMKPVEGWRAWSVHSGPRLCALANAYVWMPGPNHAVCMAGTFILASKDEPGSIQHGHPVDEICTPSCGCGFWAYSFDADIGENAEADSYALVGKVRMWGRVQPFDLGYRAEWAEVVELWTTGRMDLAAFAEIYGVPVVPTPEWFMDVIRATGEKKAYAMEKKREEEGGEIKDVFEGGALFLPTVSHEREDFFTSQWCFWGGVYFSSVGATILVSSPAWLDLSVAALNIAACVGFGFETVKSWRRYRGR